jgi:hypothetical protein
MMDVLFLRNPDTGEVRRFFVESAVRGDGRSFEGWVTVDWSAWVNANADLPAVGAAIVRYAQENGIEAPAPQEPAPVSAAGEVVVSGKLETVTSDEGIRSLAVWLEIDNMAHLFVEAGAVSAHKENLRARLAAAEALAETRLRELVLLEGERNRLRGAVKMLLASLHNIRDMRVNPTGNDDADRGRRDGYRITTELAQAAINAYQKAANALAADGEG